MVKPILYYYEGYKCCLKRLYEFVKLYVKWVKDFWKIYEKEVFKEA